MTHRTPPLTMDLLERALAEPATLDVPDDLKASIAASIRRTPQRSTPAATRISVAYGRLPQAMRVALVALLLIAFVAGLAVVGSRLLPQRVPIDASLTFRGDAARTGVVNGVGPGGAMALAFARTLPGQIVTSPAIADGIAYVGAVDGWIHAVDLARNVELWSADVDVAWSSPSLVGDLVVVGTEDRDLAAIDRRTGMVAWRMPLDAFVAGSPAVAGDRLYVATSSASSRAGSSTGIGTVVAIDAATHRVAWQEDLPGPATRSIAVAGSVLVVPTDVGIAVAFDAATGRELWRFGTPPFTDTPVIAGGKVLLAGLDPEGLRGALWAVDLRSGEEVWHHARHSGQTIVAPAVDATSGIVFAGTLDGDVVALRLDDGVEVWRQPLGAEIGAPPTKAGDVVYVATSGGLWALDASTGVVLRTVPIDGVPSSPAIADGYLVAGTQSGTLYVLGNAEHSTSIAPAASGSTLPAATPKSTAVLPSVAPLHEVWSRTARDLGMEKLFFLNAAPDGRVWVADAPRGRFVILDADGAMVDTWQPTGAAALDLVQPDNDPWGAVAFAPDGSFYVADTDHQRVLRFDSKRRLIGSWGSFGPGPGQFVSPFGITVGPDGLVYVVDDSTCRVEVFDLSGGYLRTIAGGTAFVDRCTNNVVVDGNGNVFLASGGRGDPWHITQFSPDGSVIRRMGDAIFREPVLLARGPNGEIYATSGTDRLYLIDTHGDVRATWSGLGLELVVVGRDGELYSTGAEGVVRRYALP